MSRDAVHPPTSGAKPDASEWTPSLAECVARVYGIDPLTESHWRVISECREEWARSGKAPEPGRLVSVSHLSIAELQALFPADLLSLAWFLAGVLPPRKVMGLDSDSPPGDTNDVRQLNLAIDTVAPLQIPGKRDDT